MPRKVNGYGAEYVHKQNGSKFFGGIKCFVLFIPIMIIGITYASILEKLFQTLTALLVLKLQ